MNINKIKIVLNKKYSFPIDLQLQLLREDPDNDVFLIKNRQDARMAVVRINKRDVKKDVLFEIAWLKNLKNKHIRVPEIIDTKTGKSFFIDKEGRVYVTFKYIEGTHLKIKPGARPDLKLVAEAAKALAKLHNTSLSINLNMPRKRTILTEISRALQIKNKFIKYSEGGDEFVKELNFYKEWAEKHGNKDYLIHNDYRPGNVFFKRSKVLAILDFDWSCMGPAIKDVGHSLAEWSFPDGAKRHWQDIFNAFLESYNQEAKNKIKLDNNLYHWICFSCLSDAATYFADLANKNIFKKIASSHMYRKFLYFKRFIR